MSGLSRVHQVGPSRPDGWSDTPASQPSPGNDSPHEVPIGAGRIAKGLPETGRRFLEMGRELQAALRIRTAGTAVNLKSEILEEMKATLEKVMKSFPPFPPGSEERVQELKRYATLRAQIDRLTLPSDEAPQHRERPSAVPPESEYTLAGDGSGAVRTVRREDVAEEPAELPIPELREGALDEDIRGAYEGLLLARRTLDAERATLLEFSPQSGQLEGTAPLTEAEAATTASMMEASLAETSLHIMAESRTWMFHFLA